MKIFLLCTHFTWNDISLSCFVFYTFIFCFVCSTYYTHRCYIEYIYDYFNQYQPYILFFIFAAIFYLVLLCIFLACLHL